uniref:KIB1-4 beta-propeller domain-containing protein n=1 Tax=Aegilops tauschii TaxID=37682 RepID=M8C158_AEGTA
MALAAVSCRARVVGSGNGRLAVAVDGADHRYDYDVLTLLGWQTVRVFLLDPRGGGEVCKLPPPPTGRDDNKCVLKAVFTPDAGRGTVVATCNSSKVFYIDTGSARGRNMAWTAVDVVEGHAGHLTDLAFDAGGGKLYCLDSCGVVHVLGIPHNCQDPAPVARHPLTRLPADFPAPYDDVFALTRTKHLFFCHGSLHQVWQNTSAAVKLASGLRISLDEIHVVRYDPGRWPAWETVKDLGGSSVFVGRNTNPAVVRAAGAGAVLGVRPNCVYWIIWQRVPMVLPPTH